MMYLQKSFTVPAAPEKITACEACVYGAEGHAPWCVENPDLWLGREEHYRSGNPVTRQAAIDEFVSYNEELGI